MADDDKKAADKKFRKKACPITRRHFREEARDIPVQVLNRMIRAEAKTFASGSLGWYANTKIKLWIGDNLSGAEVYVQAQVILTVIGSSELPK